MPYVLNPKLLLTCFSITIYPDHHQYMPRSRPLIICVYRVRILSKCRRTVTFASKNRSTQFLTHGSSYRSRGPEEIFETHFLKHTSVRLWIAVEDVSICLDFCSSLIVPVFFSLIVPVFLVDCPALSR